MLYFLVLKVLRVSQIWLRELVAQDIFVNNLRPADPLLEADFSIGSSCCTRRMQRGQVVRAPDLQSGGSGFKSRSDHYLELFLRSPWFNSSAALVNSQLVCLLPAGILNAVFEIFVSSC